MTIAPELHIGRSRPNLVGSLPRVAVRVLRPQGSTDNVERSSAGAADHLGERRFELAKRMVEAGGVEPPSEKARREETTCVAGSICSAGRFRTDEKAAA